jgi:hypothetical protein
MILATVTFTYPDGVDPDAFVRTSSERRHLYVGLAGLRQKLYWVASDHLSAGGTYVWESREAAERVYTPSWRTKAAEVFGAEPSIHFAELTDAISNQPLG